MFPIKNPGQQIIPVETIVSGVKNWGVDIFPSGEAKSIATHFSVIWRKILTIADKGSEIVVPIEGIGGAELFRERLWIDPKDFSKSYFITAVIRFKGVDESLYQMDISADEDRRDFNSPDSLFQILKDAPELPFGPNYDTKGTPISLGTPILKTAIDNAPITFKVRLVKEGTTPGNFNFVNLQDKPYYLP